MKWSEVSGSGTVYSYSVVHRPQSPAFETPYVVAIVELAEGPRILTDLVGIEEDDVKIGMPVKLAFTDAGDVALYQFTKA